MLTLNDDQFAQRFYSRELRGFLTKDFAVPQSTTAMLLRDDKLDRVVGPGETLVASGFGQLLGEWLHLGRDKDCLVLARANDVQLQYSPSRLLTGDPIFLDLAFKLVVKLKPGSEALFLHNLMGDKMSLSLEQLRDSLLPEARDSAQMHLRQHRIQELADRFPDSLKELEMEMEARLQQVLALSGLAFVQLRGLDFRCQAWDERTATLSHAFGEVMKKKVELDTRKQLFEFITQEEVQAIAEETKKLEQHELRIQLWERMRRAAQTDKMNELKSERDFANFLREMDRDKLLKEGEIEEFKRNLADKLEDRDRARAHLVRMVEVKNEFEYRQQEFSLRHHLTADQQAAEAELERARLNAELGRVDLELQIRRKQEEAELAAAKLRADVKGVDLDVEERRRDQERRDQAEKEKQRLESKREEMRQEIEYYEALGKMPHEALLMAAPDATKASLLASLAKLKVQGGMTTEQILAMAVASGSSPQAAEVLKQRLSQASSIDSESMTERRIEEQKKFREELQKSHDVFVQGYRDVFEKALKTLAEVAQSRGQAPPIYYPPFPGYPPAYSAPPPPPAYSSPPPPPAAPTTPCPRCHQPVPANANFCPYCGREKDRQAAS